MLWELLMAESNNIPKGFDIGKQYAPIQTEKQKEENSKRNKERWAQYDEEYRKAWSETSKRKMQEWWDSLTPEQRAYETAKRQEWWDSKDEAYRKIHASKSQIWRQDVEKVLAYRQKMIASGKWRDPEIYREIYYKTLSYNRCDRYNESNLYKQLSKEYNIPYQTVLHIAYNLVPTGISSKEHEQNIKIKEKANNDYKKEREKKWKEEQEIRHNKKFWFTWELISPGKGSEELYDYANSLRTSNQRMPINPSLVYYFREQGMSAMEIRQYCKENKIYENNDYSYWYKIEKHQYPWYSTEKSITYKFDTTAEAKGFISKTFSGNVDLDKHGSSEEGCSLYGKLIKFGPAKGWIVRKVKKCQIGVDENA